jgi:3-dehydroquinate synthase
MPTSLLSQVDAAIGGKTGIDLEVNNIIYKNQIGSIYQADYIFIDPTTINSLNRRDYLSGMGEVIKYGLCFDKDLFGYLSEDFKLEDIIKTCVKIKTKITLEDEFENGQRLILNFGHTLGHAIESLNGFNISHGEAVAIGMLYEVSSEDLRNKLMNLYDKLGINYKIDIKLSDLRKYILQDKKIKETMISLPLVTEIGKAEIKRINLQDYLGGLNEYNW